MLFPRPVVWIAPTATRLAQIDGIVQAEIQAGHFPGAVVLVGRGKKVLYYKAFGLAIAEPAQEPMRKDTIFDLASLTKPLATATAVMILVDRGKLDPNDYRSANICPPSPAAARKTPGSGTS